MSRLGVLVSLLLQSDARADFLGGGEASMDALTWFKTAFQREGATPEPSADVPLHLAAARLRPSHTAPTDDWDAAIARAKMKAAWEMQVTPRPSPAPRGRAREATQATLDALVGRGYKRLAVAKSLFGPAKRT